MDEEASRPFRLPRRYTPHTGIAREASLTPGQINRLMLELRFAIDADELPPLLLLPPDGRGD